MFKAFKKALSAMRHSPQAPFGFQQMLARTRFDYRKAIGDGLDSSVVTAPIQWIQRAAPEANLTVRRRDNAGKVTQLDDNPMLALIARPNAFYGDLTLWTATLMSYCLAGNAYWIKLRNGIGRPGELWYVPHWLMEPKGSADGTEFLTHYLYSPGGGHQPIRLDPTDVVHFRQGMDPRNPRLGLSPIDGVVREIFMDLESSNFVASLLRNMGVPGVVISPKNGGVVSAEDVEATKAWFAQAFSGDRRGGPLVMGAPTDVSPYGFNPQQMNMGEARDIAEERICACLGIPAAVVGFGSGLQSTKVGATMEEMVKLAWRNGVLPILRVMADEIDRSLLPDFGSMAGLKSGWDVSDVLALQDDLDKKASRVKSLTDGGIIQVYEAREDMGYEVDDSHRIYLRPAMALEVPAGMPATPGDGQEAVPMVAAETPQDTALNGAQIVALRDVVQAVANGEIPADTGVQLIVVGFPAIGEERARQILAPLAGFARAPASGQDGKSGGDKARAGSAARRSGAAYLRTLQRQEGPLAKGFEQTLKRFFKSLGQEARLAAAEVIAPKDAKTAGAPAGETKSDAQIIAAILKKLGIPAHRAAFKKVYEAHYLETAAKVSDAAQLLGISGSLPDPVARAIAAAGGRRSGLVDLTTQAREGLFDALAEGRAAGEGAAQLAERIGAHIESGPWGSSEIRARTIARTETKYAQNVSTIERARAASVERFIVFDGRLGPDRSDPDHIARDGSIVTADEASQMASDEHPNGTLSFAPYFGDDD